jgi:hypothetical protein
VLSNLSEVELSTLCRNAINKSLPLFPYHYHGFEAEIQTLPTDNYYIGVCNKDTSPLTKDGLFKSLIPGQPNVQAVSTGIPDRVIIYRQEGVVPVFTLSALDSYRPEYERFEKNKEYTSHWDVGLCERMKKEFFNLEPTDTLNIIEMWVKCILYGMITRNESTGMYQIKSKRLGGMPLSGYKVDLGKSRKEAFNFFANSLPAINNEIKAFIKGLDIQGPDNIIIKRNAEAKRAAADGTYLADISLCPISIDQIELYPDEANLINDELDYIINEL